MKLAERGGVKDGVRQTSRQTRVSRDKLKCGKLSTRAPIPRNFLRAYKRYNNKVFSGALYHEDATDFLRSIEKNTADIVFLDPPFNIGKKYDGSSKSDRLPDSDYELWLHTIFDESIRVVKPGGALYLYHLPKWAMRFGRYLEQHLEFRHWISVSMKGGFARGNRLYPAHYALLYFTDGAPGYFVRPKLTPATCRHCGGTIKDYGGYKKIIDTKGLNLSDVWDDLSPVRHNHRKNRVQNELPKKFMERIIEISGPQGGVYVDPFAGGGTGVIEAIQGRMHFLACDKMEENGAIIAERLEGLKRGKHGEKTIA